jgi:hypothetical protein
MFDLLCESQTTHNIYNPRVYMVWSVMVLLAHMVGNAKAWPEIIPFILCFGLTPLSIPHDEFCVFRWLGVSVASPGIGRANIELLTGECTLPIGDSPTGGVHSPMETPRWGVYTPQWGVPTGDPVGLSTAFAGRVSLC